MSEAVFERESITRAMRLLDIPIHQNFSEDDVRSRWRKVIERVHPDAGGTTYLAEEANAARDLLLNWIRAGRPLPSYKESSKATENSATPNLELVAKTIVSAGNWVKWAVGGVVTVIFWGVMAAIAVDVYKKITAASCEVSGVRSEPDVYFINGEYDAGYTVTAKIKNTGFADNLRILFTLSTSEGEFKRQYNGNFSQMEEKIINAKFHEPTIESKNIRSNVRCEKG